MIWADASGGAAERWHGGTIPRLEGRVDGVGDACVRLTGRVCAARRDGHGVGVEGSRSCDNGVYWRMADVAAAGEALEVLKVARRLLLGRLAEAVVANRSRVLSEAAEGRAPLACDFDLKEMTSGLARLESVIAGLQELTGEAPGPSGTVEKRAPARLFDGFISLVAEGRLEEASRALSTVFQMALERAITATKFFSRVVRSDPAIVDRLRALPEQVRTGTDSQCMRVLVATFGFQAVESQLAIQALALRGRSTEGESGGTGPAVSGPPAQPGPGQA